MIDTRPIWKQLTDHYTQQIATGKLSEGADMPSASQLVQTHGISSATASRVLGKLRESGLTDATIGVGTVVASGARVRAIELRKSIR